ncbi:protein CcmA, bactofilin family [Limimonas halophila]|uniref:Protein CcmA, bactofilin family n=1 Tax=Limimonas halophila TaxID=1082479 RepID=A0A1G7NWD3_9PROT|nr:polymer-forming cytoskeletal protein [Limimonas halophila]SDF77520.1 protein CcmA, bactofilin family [Limimonas halophila]
MGQLVIGRSVRFRGTIDNTRHVIVHGRANATLPSGSLEVAEGGLFTGRVDVEFATIAGTFDGTLTVAGRLTVAATGVVTGTVRYDELVVEAGGEISGDIARTSAPAQAPPPAEAATEDLQNDPPTAGPAVDRDRTPELV